MTASEQDVADYLQLRRSLGHELATASRLLPRFVAYMNEIEAATITIPVALAWALLPDPPAGSTVGPARMTAVRGFARFMSGRDPNTQVPPPGLLPHRQRWRPPFLYTDDDIAAMLAAARQRLQAPVLRAETYETLLGLLAVTGMRVGEAIKLDDSDVDWHDGILLVRESKFGKSRLVPVHDSTMVRLADYAEQRRQVRPRPHDPSLFISSRGTRLCYQVVGQTFRTLIDAVGIGADQTAVPRLHDLRHTFAVQTLVAWYRDVHDVQARLPWLSTYLGHRDPRSTYWYLSAAPELLALATGRIQTRGEGVA
jgi:integrase